MEEEAAVARLGCDQVLSILHLLPAESVLSIYAEVALLGALSARRVPVKGASPWPRASHSLNLVAGWLVLFGGGCEGGRHLDDTWVAYVGNGAGNRSSAVFSWQQLDSGTPSGRFGHSCSIVGDALVLFGGINDQGQRLNDTWIGQIICEESRRMKISWRLLESGSRLGDTWLLDLSNGLRSGIWHQIEDTEPLPLSRSGHTLTWIGGSRMVLFGGRGSEFDVLNDVWLLDINERYPKWKELKYDLSSVLGEMPSPRVGHSATLVLGGKILVYGGEDSQRRRKDDFWTLDLPALLQFESGSKKMTKRMWKKLRIDGQCPNYRSFHGACVDTSGCHVYIFGGMVDGLVHPAEASVFTSNCLIIDLKISLKIFRQTFTMLTFHLADIGHYNDGPNWCSSANCGGMHTCLPLRMSLSAYGFKLAFLCQVHMFPKNVCQYHPEQIVVSLPLMGSLMTVKRGISLPSMTRLKRHG
uniref:Uncharacterized protein n=1 Tax=Oryza glumipatula TaxID=40148 RepID=A0A0E0ASH4_9ORYZ